MKGTVKGSDLARAVGAVSKFTADKPTQPILGCIRVGMDVLGSVEFYGTDIENGLSVKVPCSVVEPGSVALPASLLAGMSRELGADAEVVLVSDENGNAVATVGRRKLKLPGTPATDFPAVQEVPEPAVLRFKGMPLAMGIRRTAFCAARDKAHYTLSGLRLKVTDGTVTLNATDGHRMAQIAVPTEGESVSDRQVVLPTDALKSLADIIEAEADVTLLLGSGLFGVTCGDTSLHGRLIEGAFPAVEYVLASAFAGESRFAVPVKELSEALRWAMLTSDSKTRALKLDFKGGTALTVSARDVELETTGEAEHTMAITCEGHGDLVVGVNGAYLLDGLALAVGETATLISAGQASPIAMQADGAPAYVVMTMRLIK